MGVIVIKSGLTELDALTGGFKSGEFIIVAGAPHTGKTALLQTFINNLVTGSPKEPHILYFSFLHLILLAF